MTSATLAIACSGSDATVVGGTDPDAATDASGGGCRAVLTRTAITCN